jgi:hypothetical protein
MNTKPNTQTKMIAAHLKAGNTITALEALQKLGCFRLAARIADLRKSGMHIVTSYTDRDGKRWATYRLKEAV